MYHSVTEESTGITLKNNFIHAHDLDEKTNNHCCRRSNTIKKRARMNRSAEMKKVADTLSEVLRASICEMESMSPLTEGLSSQSIHDSPEEIYDTLFEEIYDTLVDKVYDMLFNEIFEETYASLYEEVYDSVYEEVYNSLYERIHQEIAEEVYESCANELEG